MGQYFSTHRGLRQGDPLSPLLFNIAADVLASLVYKAQKKHLIKGVVSNLLADGVPILQYADDTVLLVNLNEDYILNLKFILYCFNGCQA